MARILTSLRVLVSQTRGLPRATPALLVISGSETRCLIIEVEKANAILDAPNAVSCVIVKPVGRRQVWDPQGMFQLNL
jgi:hypothetical protein